MRPRQSFTSEPVYKRLSIFSAALGEEMHFGVIRPANPEAIQGTLYLFHGGDGDDRQPIDLGIQGDARVLKNVQLVLPSIGASCLYSTESAFFDELVPMIEHETRTRSSTRWVSGYSLGAQAALNAFFRRPEWFKGVGAIAPAIFDMDCFDDQSVAAYAERTESDLSVIRMVVGLFRNEFQTADVFRTYDPIELAKGIDPERLAGKEIYLDSGTLDLFGLCDGVRKLHQILSEKRIEHFSECIEGGRHDALYIRSRFPVLFNKLIHT